MKGKAELRAWMADTFGAHCEACGSTDRLTLDHIIPRIRGGSSRRENLRLLCFDCNQSKDCKVLPWHRAVQRADVAVMVDKTDRLTSKVLAA